MEQNIKQFTVKAATVDDGERIMDLYTSVVPEWPIDAFYVKSVLEVLPGAILITVDETDTIIGILMVIPTCDDVIMLSCFVVRPDMRKKGLGSELLCTAQRRAGERNISILAVLSMIPIYQRYGPRSTGVVETLINGIRLSKIPSVAYDVSEQITLRNRDESGVKKAVMDYDKTVFPIGRDSFLDRFMFGHPAAHIKAAFIEDRIVGYGYLREPRESFQYYFPVLYGDSAEIVDVLLAELMRFVPEGGKMSFLVRNDNAHAMKLLRQIASIEFEVSCSDMAIQPLVLGWDKAYFCHFSDIALI